MLWESNIKSSLRSRAENYSSGDFPKLHPIGAVRRGADPERSRGITGKSRDFSREKCVFSPCAAGLNRFNTRKSDDV
jgi:hypothetical protein